MLFPVRCFTCGKVVADKWEAYSKRVAAGEAPGQVLDSLGVYRYCCRRMFISHVDVIDDVIQFTVLKPINSQGELNE
ncbi:MAG: DNA-directed RNA polymerase subunit N [Candidatus Marsarchaeota archaeon]|nr:DNA-directed RNA polymerase subunit N [Candidatus Marsarchaeota archaeon]